MSKQSKLISGIVTLIAIGIVVAFLFLRGTNDEKHPEKVRIGSFSVAIDYGPYLIAKEKGWFEEALKSEHVGVEYTTFQTLPPINESFATGRIDIVFEAEPPAIIGRAAGIDLRIAGISCSLTQEVLVPSSSQVKTIGDLKGKKIAVLAGTSSHYGLFKIAQQSGLAKSEFTVVDMPPPDAKAAFETGVVDGWAVWPPWVEQELVSGKGRILQGAEAKIHSIMAVRGEFANKYPRITGEIAGVIDQTREWMRKNPEEAQKVLAKALDLPLDVVKLAWPKHDWSAKITPEVIADIQAKADFLKSEGFIKQGVNVEKDLIRVVEPITKSVTTSKP